MLIRFLATLLCLHTSSCWAGSFARDQLIGRWSSGDQAIGTYVEENYLDNGVYCRERQLSSRNQSKWVSTLGSWRLDNKLILISVEQSTDPNQIHSIGSSQHKIVVELTEDRFTSGIQTSHFGIVEARYQRMQGEPSCD